MSQFKRVVVTGYGAVTPLGETVTECWQAIMDKKIGYQYVDKTESNISSHFLGLIDKEPSMKGIPAAIRRRLPRYARLTMAAARESHANGFWSEVSLVSTMTRYPAVSLWGRDGLG